MERNEIAGREQESDGVDSDGQPATDPQHGDDVGLSVAENPRTERFLLEHYVGRRTRNYLRTYDKSEEGRAAVIINWAAFFFPLPWLMYRKLFLEGAVFAVVPVLVAFVHLPASQILSVASGGLVWLFGHGYYVYKALLRIEDIEYWEGTVD